MCYFSEFYFLWVVWTDVLNKSIEQNFTMKNYLRDYIPNSKNVTKTIAHGIIGQ